MMLVFKGERRFVAVSLANDPGVVSGATLTGTPTVTVVTRQGETTVAGVVLSSPAPPNIVGAQVRVWCEFANVAIGRYWILVTVTLSTGEIAKARAAVVVEG